MKISEIHTPAILLDLNKTEHNLRKYCDSASAHGKQIWPMVKTHKSTELMKLQMAYGCTGVLCGTLDEAEAASEAGISNIMYAYPVATDVSVGRVIALSEKCSGFVIRIDSRESAAVISKAAEAFGVSVGYTVIIDSGLHRFGIAPEKAAEFVRSLDSFKNLVFRGISTHPGHVYSAKCHGDIARYVADEKLAVKTSVEVLKAAGYVPEIISSGSTPTFFGSIDDENINIYHPGNYIFNDSIQLSTETAAEDECALRVLASVISHPQENLFICDAGAKCLGLDLGAHGNDSIRGHGTVIGHSELTVFSLSEEVGKLHAEGPTDLKIGDKIVIIPNHSCSTANLTGYFVGVRGDEVERLIAVDVRSNSTTKNIIL